MLKQLVGGIVLTSADPRFFRFLTRIAVIHRRLQQQNISVNMISTGENVTKRQICTCDTPKSTFEYFVD